MSIYIYKLNNKCLFSYAVCIPSYCKYGKKDERCFKTLSATLTSDMQTFLVN